jgi:hypothetical protein
MAGERRRERLAAITDSKPEGDVMRRLATALAPLAAAALLLAGPAAGAPAHRAHAKTAVRVVMRDPGCHWFAVGHGFKTKLAVRGPVALTNLDEAALLVRGHGHTRRVRVGKRLGLARGTYVIKMVHQAKDDNTLRLLVR